MNSGDDLDALAVESFDLHALFVYYNTLYFEDALGPCSVEWSSQKMTRCAGVCEYTREGGCRIKLSEPILKLRPLHDLKETLLHEMIHAFLFIRHMRDRDPHGQKFREHMMLINRATCPDSQRPAFGYNVNVFHNMIDEVQHYQTHHWKCQRCGNLIRRAMNRPPQEADCTRRCGRGADCRDVKCHYHMHLKHCGGEYDKVAEPPGFQDRKKGKRSAHQSGGNSAAGSRGSAPKRSKKGTRLGGSENGASITDFFDRTKSPDVLPKTEHGTGTELCTDSDVPSHREGNHGTEGSHAAAESGSDQGYQTLVPQPSRAELRQTMASAALRRMHGGTELPIQDATHSATHSVSASACEAKPLQQQTDCIDLT